MDRVSIRRDAAERWWLLMQHALPRQGIDPYSLPEEQARVEPDGALTLCIALPNGGEANMRVAPEEWRWYR